MRASRYSLGRICVDCPAPISNASTTGRCKPCYLKWRNAQPDFRERVSATLKRRCREDPEFYQRAADTLRRNRTKRNVERIRERAREAVKLLHTPEINAKRLASFIRNGGHRRLRWIPDEYRGEYRRLVKNGMSAPGAADKIRSLMAQPKQPRTFEEKLQLVEQGKLNIYTMPDLRSPDPSGTLGGVSTGWMG